MTTESISDKERLKDLSTLIDYLALGRLEKAHQEKERVGGRYMKGFEDALDEARKSIRIVEGKEDE